MLSVAQAQQAFINGLRCNLEAELVPLEQALGRVAASDLQATIDVPGVDNSAMDGFAVVAADVQECPVQLPVVQRIPAGDAGQQLQPNTAARIFTGGPVPDGADAVVIQENCEIGDGNVVIHKPAQVGDNIRPRGQDISTGALVIHQGQKLSALDLALAASVGCAHLSVYKPLRVAIFSTGNELAEPGRELQPGQIYNSNRSMLGSLCRQMGHQVIDCGIVEDTLAATRSALAEAASRADIVISSGGVSVGEEDHIKPAVESLGEIAHWKVQMKPGKPVVFGHIASTPFFGLPGNPVSSFVVFQLLAVPVLNVLQGNSSSLPTAFPVRAAFARAEVSREEYIRVKIQRNAAGELCAEPYRNQSSGILFSLAWCDGLVRQAIGEKIEPGSSVEYYPLRDGSL